MTKVLNNIVIKTERKMNPLYVWKSNEPEPAKWTASDGKTVYRSNRDYLDEHATLAG